MYPSRWIGKHFQAVEFLFIILLGLKNAPFFPGGLPFFLNFFEIVFHRSQSLLKTGD
jgi:hypothetical protein